MCCRILQAFAEDQAIEDAIYYMGEALRKEVIDLDVFLKVTAIAELNLVEVFSAALCVFHVCVVR
jgi:hypothetical protein